MGDSHFSVFQIPYLTPPKIIPLITEVNPRPLAITHLHAWSLNGCQANRGLKSLIKCQKQTLRHSALRHTNFLEGLYNGVELLVLYRLQNLPFAWNLLHPTHSNVQQRISSETVDDQNANFQQCSRQRQEDLAEVDRISSRETKSELTPGVGTSYFSSLNPASCFV